MRVVVTVAGLALIAWGAYGIAAHVDAAAWAVWFAGAAVLHDAVLVPVVLVAGVATGRLPGPWRRAARTALVIGGAVTLVAAPLVLGYGRRADEPSRLPLPYDRNLAVVLAVVVVLCAAGPPARSAGSVAGFAGSVAGFAGKVVARRAAARRERRR
ncbi:hypothetical protein BZB76_4202 [Actinomadura pelletieri DSM 43383]|uniref:Uncharacterized protein n=1 Tax=Actinomadura pelletieri DSM 43383 TaxID=1120940 RepID=A0A495QLS7_9ACTN|nr:hypothetical protein [Actinomadura pelletieri]RKS73509.1 hypothetical protein BZB76_4202 [Actinomadura pelletieri DSM 43383]